MGMKKESWKQEVREGGSLKETYEEAEIGCNAWSTSSDSSFMLRSPEYFVNKTKVAAGETATELLGVDWFKSTARMDHILARPDNRVKEAFTKGLTKKNARILAVNLQIPATGRAKEHYSLVIYYLFESEDAKKMTLLHRFMEGGGDGEKCDDEFRTERLKLVNRVVKGPWILRAAVGNNTACLIGKALTCKYHKGEGYLEVDVDIGSSAVASTIVHVAMGCVASVCVDLGFIVEARHPHELPEQLLGAVRIHRLELESAVHVDAQVDCLRRRGGGAKVGIDCDDSV